MQMNQVVYSQLVVANVGVTVHHLVKQYKDEKYYNAAWNNLCEFYDWQVLDPPVLKTYNSQSETGKTLTYHFRWYCIKKTTT